MESRALFAIRFGGLASTPEVVTVMDHTADLMEQLDLVVRLQEIVDPICAEAGLPPHEIEGLR